MKINYLVALSCALISSVGIAQSWRQKTFSENDNYFDIIKEKRKELSIAKSDQKKNKQFERWAYFWDSHVNEDGTFPNPMNNYNAWKDYNSENKSKSTSTNPWSIIGPTVIPESIVSFYAGMGRLNVVTFNPTNTDEIWVGSPGGGVWRSNDGGANWIPKGDNIPNMGVSDIVIDPTNPDVIYLATGDFDGGHNNSIGVLKSIDHGEN